MITKETYDEILQGLAEVLKSKNTEIILQKYEIDCLKEKLSSAEKQIETMKGSEVETCRHCGEKLIVGKNHSQESYEIDLCDECMDLYYGYCDNCGNLFHYYDEMTEHDIPRCNVVCKKCKGETQYDK